MIYCKETSLGLHGRMGINMEPQTLQEILARGETATVKFNGRVVGVPEAAISDIQRNIANNVLRRGHYAQGLQPGADLLRRPGRLAQPSLGRRASEHVSSHDVRARYDAPLLPGAGSVHRLDRPAAGRGFASRFLRIPPLGGHPCDWLGASRWRARSGLSPVGGVCMLGIHGRNRN